MYVVDVVDAQELSSPKLYVTVFVNVFVISVATILMPRFDVGTIFAMLSDDVHSATLSNLGFVLVLAEPVPPGRCLTSMYMDEQNLYYSCARYRVN